MASAPFSFYKKIAYSGEKHNPLSLKINQTPTKSPINEKPCTLNFLKFCSNSFGYWNSFIFRFSMMYLKQTVSISRTLYIKMLTSNYLHFIQPISRIINHLIAIKSRMISTLPRHQHRERLDVLYAQFDDNRLIAKLFRFQIEKQFATQFGRMFASQLEGVSGGVPTFH